MTPADLIPTIAPEFAGVDASAAIAVAEMQVGPNLCRDKRPLLVAYLAAHIMSLGNRTAQAGGASGEVSSLSEGQLSISFGASGVMGGLGQTAYGVEYDRLSRGCVFAARTRVPHV